MIPNIITSAYDLLYANSSVLFYLVGRRLHNKLQLLLSSWAYKPGYDNLSLSRLRFVSMAELFVSLKIRWSAGLGKIQSYSKLWNGNIWEKNSIWT